MHIVEQKWSNKGVKVDKLKYLDKVNKKHLSRISNIVIS